MKYQIEKETAKDANNYKRPSKYVAPTYISPILNRVNGWSCATRPATVGAIATDVFPSFISKSENRSQEGWKQYYIENNSAKYEQALAKLKSKFEDVRTAIDNVTDEDLKAWLDDFLFCKTFNGLYYQEAILNDIAKRLNKTVEPASSADESAGIDGYIDGKAYSVKPTSYKNTDVSRQEKINAIMVYYYEIDSTTLEYEIEEN